MKRVLDFLVALLALVVLSPLMLLIGLVVRIGMGSPVLFRQVRPGRAGKPFALLKFSTMRPATEAGKPASDAERLTSLGKFLRRTSLDELPQLINVLKGEMSLVGPRPLLMEYLPLYNADQARRHEVRPGITGWAQVNGRNSIGWEEKFELDVWYVDHRSVMLDARILWMTAARVLGAKGISQPGHATMERFQGTKS